MRGCREAVLKSETYIIREKLEVDEDENGIGRRD